MQNGISGKISSNFAVKSINMRMRRVDSRANTPATALFCAGAHYWTKLYGLALTELLGQTYSAPVFSRAAAPPR